MPFIFWSFISLLVLAPLPFGMVYGLVQAAFALLFFALVGGYCLISRGVGSGLERIRPEAALFFLVLGWALVQLASFTPAFWHHPLWAEAAGVLGRELNGGISLARGAGFESLMRLLTYGAVFWLALQLGRDRQAAERIVGAVALAATVYAVYGLAVYFGGDGQVLWVERPTAADSLSGTFINRNNFATYLGLGLLCAAGLYLHGFLKALQTHRIGRDRILHLLQQAFVRGAPQLAGVLILLTALFLTGSRAGVVASLVALLIMVVFMGPLNRISSRLHKWLTITLLVAAGAIFFQSGEGWLHRLTATDLEKEARLLCFEQTWQAIDQAPWTGYGLGSFEQTFLLFADEKTTNMNKAHNDWLEMIFELGWPAALAWFAMLAGLTLRCLFGFFRRRRSRLYPLVGFSAGLLVGLHALADFSLQIPAVAITFVALLGVGVAQTSKTPERSGRIGSRR